MVIITGAGEKCFSAGFDVRTNQEGTQAFIQKIRDLERKVEEPLSLKDAGITEEQMDKSMEGLVSLAIKDPNMYTTPCKCSTEALRQLFKDMWAGEWT